MKTPEEVKKGLEHCLNCKACVDCVFDKRDFPRCIERMAKDALSLIKQLEEEVKSRKAETQEAKKWAKRFEGERDAAVQFITQYAHEESDGGGDFCEICNAKNCNKCCNHNEGFEWRGPCEENGCKEP